MKKLIAIALLTFSFTASAMAAEFKGFVEDTACAGKPGMAGDSECAKSCMKRASPAVLVTTDGKIYKIDDQSKIVSWAGENVVVEGTLKGDTITISKVS